jgi:hypothetical protein
MFLQHGTELFDVDTTVAFGREQFREAELDRVVHYRPGGQFPPIREMARFQGNFE